MKRNRTVKPRLEVLEERLCLAADVWTPQNGSDLYNVGANWSLGHVPDILQGEQANFVGGTSDAPCVINTPTLPTIILSDGYNGQMTVQAGMVATLIGGFLDEDPVQDFWNVNFGGKGAELRFSSSPNGPVSSYIYNANFTGTGSMQVSSSNYIIAGELPGYSTTLITPCTVDGVMWLGYSDTNSAGTSPVAFRNSGANNPITVEGVPGASGEVDVFANPREATLVEGAAGSTNPVFKITADGHGDTGLLSFWDRNSGTSHPEQTIVATLDGEGGNINFNGGQWLFNGSPVGTNVLFMDSGSVSLYSSYAYNTGTTSNCLVQLSGNALIKASATLQVLTLASLLTGTSGPSQTTIDGRLSIPNSASILQTNNDVVFEVGSTFLSYVGNGSGGIGEAGQLYDPNANVTIEPGATVTIQIDPGTTVPDGTIYTLIQTGSVAGIKGEFSTINGLDSPPGFFELNAGNPNGEKNWQLESF